MLPASPHGLTPLLFLHLLLCAVALQAGVENLASTAGNAAVTGRPSLPTTSESRRTALVVTMPYQGNPDANGLFIYQHLTGSIERLLTEGDALPSLNGEVGSLVGLPTDSVYGPFGILPQLNTLGLGCITTEIRETPLGTSANEALLRFGGPEGVAVLMAESQSVGNTGRFVEAFRHRPYMNDETGITWVISTRSTLLQAPPAGFPDINDNPDHALMAWLPQIQTQPILVAQSGEMHTPTTGGSAEVGILFQPRINNLNQILVASGARAPGELNWYEADHLHLWTWEDGLQTIASVNQNIPGGPNRKISSILSSRLGQAGEVFFLVEWDQPGSGGSASTDGQALLKWQAGVLTNLLAEGDPVPGEPSLVVHSWADLTEVTASGKIAMVLRIGLAGSQYPFDAIFRYDALGLHEVIPPMAEIPDITQLESIGSIGMNDLGLITFEGRVRLTADTVDAVFLTDGQKIVEVSRGSSFHEVVGFSVISPITSEGQLSFVNLSSSTSSAGLFTPDLALKPFGNFWEDRSSFTFGIPPSAVHRVTLQGDPEMQPHYFGGPSGDVTVRRLNIGGAGSSVVFIDSGGSITALEGIHVATNGSLDGSWTLNGTLNCTGSLSPGPGGMSLNGAVNLAGSTLTFTAGGPLTVTGDVTLPTTLQVQYPAPEPGDYPVITATGTLTGSLTLSSAPEGQIYQLTQTPASQLRLQVRAAVTAYEQWQIIHFGSNVPANAQPEADPDGDQQDNLTEFTTGTLPQDGASSFRLSITRLPSGLMRLTWPGRSGRSYRIESSLDPASGWTPLITLPGEADAPMQADVSAGSEPTFYRVTLVE